MQPLSRQCQQCLPGAAKLLEPLEDQTNRLLNANIGIKTGILLAVFCLACLGILDRPARVRVFPPALAGSSGRMSEALSPVLPAHPLAWGRHRRGVYNPAAGGLVSPIAKLLFKTCKQDSKRTRPVSFSRNGRIVFWSGVGSPIRNPGNRSQLNRSRIGNSIRSSLRSCINARTTTLNIITASIGRRPPFERSDRSNDASGPARNISKST